MLFLATHSLWQTTTSTSRLAMSGSVGGLREDTGKKLNKRPHCFLLLFFSSDDVSNSSTGSLDVYCPVSVCSWAQGRKQMGLDLLFSLSLLFYDYSISNGDWLARSKTRVQPVLIAHCGRLTITIQDLFVLLERPSLDQRNGKLILLCID